MHINGLIFNLKQFILSYGFFTTLYTVNESAGRGIFKKFLNPRGAKHQWISNPSPCRAGPSPHLDKVKNTFIINFSYFTMATTNR